VAWPVKKASLANGRIAKPSEAEQKRIKVEHETVQQLRDCDSWCAHPVCDEAFSCAFAQPGILAQQADFTTVIMLDFPTAGQRKLLRHTITNAMVAALRITILSIAPG